jgi:AcrR family transcriptional regulator
VASVSARRAQTRDKLIEAGLAVFAEKGVGGASVEEICDAAGFTRGAFYSNFDSKDDLCLTVLSRLGGQNLTAALEAIDSLPEPLSLSFEQIVDGAISIFLKAQRTDRIWMLAASELRLYAAREASMRDGYLNYVATTTASFARLFEDAAARFGYRLTVPAVQAVSVLHAVYEHGAIGALIAGSPVEVSERAEQLSAVLRSMLEPI